MRSSGSGRRAAAGSPGFLRRSQPRYGEKAIKVLLVAASLVSLLTTAGIVIALIPPAVEFFGKVDFGEFITGTDWSPLFKPPHFGVLPLVTATLLVTLIALLVAVPLGLGAAVYLSEYADPRVRKFFKPVLEVLAGIPTVVYGFFALKAITPLLQNIWPTGDGPQVFNALSAGFVMGIMIIPTIASLAEDAMSAVPRALRDGAFALGSSRMQVSTRVVFPAALSGIVAAIVLGISRALGETMIVAIAAGGRPNLTFNPLEGMQTMTAFIAAAGIGDLPTGSTGYQTIFAVGSLLFAMTLVMNLVSIRLVRKYREVYE
ncbi:phosphate ABC transporter permease subunit PstC [Streptomyces himalayensis]|uniref:Phosphate transport system permease protein n=1 Tax=Streptomyces himalayensis subsp. himalayensis TaxID=2756131 RepID=A0A7W0ICZ5_9ACTN|nr:phosphate ABC transporter permease subunit PstC [Streptomyces himalayensis]MBA2950704.1 phosphate ABC transporter permease subunit PstC [Streptomyces himalayensis subsp. himalayensis]